MSYLSHPDFESRNLLECVDTNEVAMKGHHASERIACLLWLHGDFVDSFFDFIYLCSMVGLIIKLSKESIITLIYLIKLRKPKQNMRIK